MYYSYRWLFDTVMNRPVALFQSLDMSSLSKENSAVESEYIDNCKNNVLISREKLWRLLTSVPLYEAEAGLKYTEKMFRTLIEEIINNRQKLDDFFCGTKSCVYIREALRNPSPFFIIRNFIDGSNKAKIFLNMSRSYSGTESTSRYNNDGETFIGKYGFVTQNPEFVSSLDCRDCRKISRIKFLLFMSVFLLCEHLLVNIAENKEIVDDLYNFTLPEYDIMKIAPESLRKFREMLPQCRLKKVEVGGVYKYGFEEIEGIKPSVEELRKNKGDVSGWVNILKCRNEPVRAEAVNVLKKIGKPAVVPLTKALWDGDSEFRRGAVEALNKINVKILDFIKKKYEKKTGNTEGGARCSKMNSPILR